MLSPIAMLGDNSGSGSWDLERLSTGAELQG